MKRLNFSLTHKKKGKNKKMKEQKRGEEYEDKEKLVYISFEHSDQNVHLDNFPYLQSERTQKVLSRTGEVKKK